MTDTTFGKLHGSAGGGASLLRAGYCHHEQSALMPRRSCWTTALQTMSGFRFLVRSLRCGWIWDAPAEMSDPVVEKSRAGRITLQAETAEKVSAPVMAGQKLGELI